MNGSKVEVAVGAFVIFGFACFAFIAIKLGTVQLLDGGRYSLTARFGNVSGLKAGAAVEIGGVKVGAVRSIDVDPKNFEARVTLDIDPGIHVPADSIASVRTSGIIGDKFIKITPGGDDKNLADGSAISETESAISLEELVSKYIFEKKE